ncbi:hypothetical protein Sjap_009022 [Stephania japonica]|uniref:Uncharacterized protein n=1 Tax=Stephania japonica TaxID=461633 RepID=A0AAP0PBE1_9MAGN
MPHDPASPPELTGERDEPRIHITVKNKSLHPSDTYFDWDPRITAQIMAAYERQAKVRYKALMNKLLSKEQESGEEDRTSSELYLHVHTKKHDGQTFIDAWSERVNAEIQRMREEMSQSAEEAGDDPLMDETDLYYKVVDVDHKGRVYGLGSTGRRYNDPGASSSQGPSSQDFATLQSNVSHLTSIVEDQQNQIQTQHEQIALLCRETLTPPTAVPTPALDAKDVYRLRMYEPEDDEETNLPLQQEWIDALSDTHPLPRPDRDN